MSDIGIPNAFRILLRDMCIDNSDVLKTSDGFFLVDKSVEKILATRNIFDFPDTNGERLACSRFFDDWFLYAVSDDEKCVYSLLKLREQEHDADDALPADGDTPGVTVSFISFDVEILLNCLDDPGDANRERLNVEINRVVAYKGQCHDKELKRYFKDPHSSAAYLVASLYPKHIASFAENGCLQVPECYKEIVQRSALCKKSSKYKRIPKFIEMVNQASGRIVCDNENIFIKNKQSLDKYEAAAILATHTGNTSVFSFAAEVEYHARFLIPLAKIKIPFFGRSIYDSAIRADMTIGDTELEGPAPFHKDNSKIVKRQILLHEGSHNAI